MSTSSWALLLIDKPDVQKFSKIRTVRLEQDQLLSKIISRDQLEWGGGA